MSDDRAGGPWVPIRLFVGSPGDVSEARSAVHDAVELYNQIAGHRNGVHVESFDWTTETYPLLAKSTQSSIDEQIGPYDIFVGIFAERIGTPTGGAVSGTVHEFEQALSLRRDGGGPLPMLYFHEGAIQRPDLDGLEQLRGVLEFEESVSDTGVARRYADVGQFGLMFLRHLADVIHDRILPSLISRRAGADSPEATGDNDRAGTVVDGDVLGLRLALEKKLTWSCKHLLAGPDTPTFATIGSLHFDGYLTDDQAIVLSWVLAGTAPSGDARVTQDFMVTAERIVSTFRAIVFDAHVRKRLRTADWELVDFDQPSGHQRDFLAVKDERAFRITPRIITRAKSEIRERTVRRLRRTSDEPRDVERRIVVIPDVSKAKPDRRDANPRVVKLAKLLEALS